MPREAENTICWAGWAAAVLALGGGGGFEAAGDLYACTYVCYYDDLVRWLSVAT